MSEFEKKKKHDNHVKNDDSRKMDKNKKKDHSEHREDHKKKEAIELRNKADQLLYETEKAAGDLGDKMSDLEKTSLSGAQADLKKALEGTDDAAIKEKTEALEKEMYALSQKVYEAQQQAAGAAPGGAAPGGDSAGAQSGPDGAVDADFKEVDDNK